MRVGRGFMFSKASGRVISPERCEGVLLKYAIAGLHNQASRRPEARDALGTVNAVAKQVDAYPLLAADLQILYG